MRIRGYGLYSILPREHSQKWVRLIKLVVSEIQNFSVSGGMLGTAAIFTKSPQSPETPPPLRVAARTHKISPHGQREGF